MTARMTLLGTFVAVVTLAILTPAARAVDPPDLFPAQLDDFIWLGSGDGTTWQSGTNWDSPVDFDESEYPNDPDRLDTNGIVEGPPDPDVTDLEPEEGANLSVALTGDLTVNIATTNVTVAALKMGGTGSAVTTSITSTGGARLVMGAYEQNDTHTNPAVPTNDPPILAEPIYTYNDENALIWSTGTQGGGKVNRIDAALQLNDNTDVEGDRDLHIYGNIYEGQVDRNTGDSIAEDLDSSLNNLLSGGKTLYIHGNIVAFGETSGDGDRYFALNQGLGLLLPEDPQNPPDSGTLTPRQGDIDMTGSFQGEGAIWLGPDGGNRVPLSTIYLRGDSSAFTGRINMNRVNLVLDHDNALGGPSAKFQDPETFVTSDVKSSNPTQSFGFNLISSDDDRNIVTDFQIAQWQTVRTASSMGIPGIPDSDIEFSGQMVQTNTRGWINLLPAGKTLTLSGPQYPLQGGDNTDTDRTYTLDGSGKTMITGGIHDRDPDNDAVASASRGALRVRGTGAVYIDFDDANAPDTPSDYSGYTFVEGSNLHYAEDEDLGTGTILSRGGAVGVDEDVTGNTDFLTKLNNSSNQNSGYLPPTPFLSLTSPSIEAIFTRYSSGGLMLAKVTESLDEYSEDLNFDGTQVANPLARAANMTLAAHEDDSPYTDYTGMITPSTSVPVNPNTYQLGGGSGTLRLANVTPQLTGARNLLVTNGGTVRLEGANTYTGTGGSLDGTPIATTRIVGKFLPSNTDQALGSARGGGADEEADEDDDPTDDILTNSTLIVTNLADGGSASSIGSSSSAAINLFIQRGTLRYEGAAVDTNRLFTVGTAGATIDASGTGALNFENTGALAIDTAEDRHAIVSNTVPGSVKNHIFGNPLAANHAPFSTEDLTPGIQVHAYNATTFALETWFEDDDSPVVINGIPAVDVVTVGEEDIEADNDTDPVTAAPNVWPGVGSANFRYLIKFGPAPARFLTLSAGNTVGGLGNNTLAPLVGDAPDIGETFTYADPAGYGTVGIRKTGVGKWILTGNNTYTGETQVQEGTLLVNGTQTGTGLTTVSAGAILGGTGTLGGAVTNNGTLAPGTSIESLATGSVTFGLDSIFEVELSGATKDQLLVTGDIDLTALGNTLDVIELAAPTLTSYVIATYSGTLMGEFESITEGWEVHYGDGSNDVITLNLVDDLLIGDYNGDGKVSAADFTVWRDSLGALTLTNRDPDNLGAVGNADFESWKEHYGEGTFGSGAGSGIAASSVPEPTSFTLLALGGLIGLAVTRRRK